MKFKLISSHTANACSVMGFGIVLILLALQVLEIRNLNLFLVGFSTAIGLGIGLLFLLLGLYQLFIATISGNFFRERIKPPL